MLQMVEKRESGFGIRLRDPERPTKVAIGIPAADSANIGFQAGPGSGGAGVAVWCRLQVHSDGTFTQSMRVENTTDGPIDVQYTLDLRLSVHRASYGQLTEGGPVPLPDSENSLSVYDGNLFVVCNRNLGAHLLGRLYVDQKPTVLAGLLESDTKPGVLSEATTPLQTVTIAPRSATSLLACFKLSPGLQVSVPEFPIASASGGSQPRPETYWTNAGTPRNFVIRRNVDYILGNCSIPVGDGVVGMVTDHVALPLGWNRDNYWQWKLLLLARKHADTLFTPEGRKVYIPAIERVLKGHVRWVFERAERPHGFWHRSYLISGKPKDGPTFQLDQQCYPFVEICSYLETFEDRDFVKDLLDNGTVAEVLGILSSKQDPETGLFPTDETPGDDAVDHPFHFSSHVLLWFTLTRLVEAFRLVGAPPGTSIQDTQALADKVREVALSHFITTEEATAEPRIAYLVDGRGQKTFYHDANDIPTVFASALGFITSPEHLTAWQSTMRFAVSPGQNTHGYASGGKFAGLGSVHSSGPWPLGYFQELLYAHYCRDAEAEKDAARRIVGAMQWDGTFGEAVDARTGRTTSKAWFSWPGSMIAAALIEESIEL